MENIFFISNNNGMTGISTALISGNYFILFTKYINNFSFAVVASLASYKICNTHRLVISSGLILD